MTTYAKSYKMFKNKIFKRILILLGIIILIAAGTGFYMFNMPHRNISEARTDYKLQASALVKEYLDDQNRANEKYLDEEGDSGIIEITGTIASTKKDFNDQLVVLLKDNKDQAGVSCTFPSDQNTDPDLFKTGDKITVKGVIRSGAAYDKDLEMYENVILEECSIINK
jgi:hypothetical protein